jgi:hypothetical protein
MKTDNEAIKRTNERLARFRASLGNNALSGNEIKSAVGKSILEMMLADTASDQFDAQATRESISKSLNSLKQ